MDEIEDAELERAMREGLAARAERVDVAVPVADRARRAARGRRTTRRVVAGAAAAAVVAVAGAGVVVGRDGDDPAVTPQTSTPSSAVPTLDGRPRLRTEYWAGLEVQVPLAWVLGSTPGVCGEVPVGEPYVGRPILTTDVCGTDDRDAVPTAPYVWLGADVPLGTVDLGDGWTRETITVEGSTLSVATQDETLREQILGSAHGQDVCRPELGSPPAARYRTSFEGTGDLVHATLCAYRRPSDDAPLSLVYATYLPERVALDTFAAVADAPGRDVRCKDTSEVVVVTGTFADPYSAQKDLWLDRDVVYDMSCGTVSDRRPLGRNPTTHLLTEDTVVPWAGDEFNRLLTGPHDGQWGYRYFIGMQG